MRENSSWLGAISRQCASTLSVMMFSVPVLKHPLYSPVLPTCVFILFATIKSALKGTCFEPADAVRVKNDAIHEELSEDGYNTASNSRKFT